MKPTVNHIAVVAILLVCLPLLIGADYMYWDNFATIAIANITNRGDTPSASQSLVLYTNVNAEITADNTAAAQLTHETSGDKLVTEYKLEYDKNGTNGTGGTPPVDWAKYDVFLPGGSDVTYYTDDNDVTVTLHVRASNAAGTLADAGTYTATQMLTVSWGDP